MDNIFTDPRKAAQINGALGGNPTSAGGGTLNKRGYNAAPFPVPDSVKAARQKMIGAETQGTGMETAMHAAADKLHPVK